MYPLESFMEGNRCICYGIVQSGAHQPDGRPILRVNNLHRTAAASARPRRARPGEALWLKIRRWNLIRSWPVLDGNGRVGRLLIVLLLHARGLLAQPLRYLLEGVEVTTGGAVETTRRLLRLFDEDAALIRARGERRTATLPAVHEVLKHRPVINLGALSEWAGVSFPAASRAIEQLMALGLVEELTGGRRNRLFAYRRHLRILNEDMEPL